MAGVISFDKSRLCTRLSTRFLRSGSFPPGLHKSLRGSKKILDQKGDANRGKTGRFVLPVRAEVDITELPGRLSPSVIFGDAAIAVQQRAPGGINVGALVLVIRGRVGAEICVTQRMKSSLVCSALPSGQQAKPWCRSRHRPWPEPPPKAPLFHAVLISREMLRRAA